MRPALFVSLTFTLFLIPAAGHGQTASPPADEDIWQLAPSERQAVLAGAASQLQSKATNDGAAWETFRRLRDEVARLNATKVRDSIEKTNRTQDLVNTALEPLRARQSIADQKMMAQMTPEQAAYWQQYRQSQANSAALSSAQQSGYQQGLVTAEVANTKKQFDMASKAIEEWKPPSYYEMGSAPAAAIVDPFGPTSPEDLLARLRERIASTCLEIDPDRGVARTTDRCSADPCLRNAHPGDYPFLADGRVLDAKDAVDAFFASCPNEVFVIRQDDVKLISASVD